MATYYENIKSHAPSAALSQRYSPIGININSIPNSIDVFNIEIASCKNWGSNIPIFGEPPVLRTLHSGKLSQISLKNGKRNRLATQNSMSAEHLPPPQIGHTIGHGFENYN
jgi:hypothetical protein